MAIDSTMLGKIFRCQVTIPGSATVAGTNLLALVRVAGYQGPSQCAVKITAKLIDCVTDRPAFIVATPRKPGDAVIAADFGTNGQPVAAGAEWSEPCDDDAGYSSFRALAAGSIAAQAVVVW